jgi:hypothetical protein
MNYIFIKINFSYIILRKSKQRTLGIRMSLFSGVTSYYVIDQSLLCIYDMKKMLGGEAKHNPHDSTYIVMLINYLISINKG